MASMTEFEQQQLASGRRPAVVVDRVHVIYRTFAGGRAVGRSGARGIMQRATRGVREVHAVRGVSFVVFEGESIGVIGHNGSGKSTLFRAITGLRPANRGAVWASDQPSLLGVSSVLIPALSGAKNVYLGSIALGATPLQAREEYDAIVKFSGIEEFIDYPMRTYSSGMSARLQFSIAATRQHAILLVDEALSVGDKAFRDKSEARIREMRENAGTTMLVSHSMRSILETSTRVIWIDHGEVRMNGDPEEVVAAYEAHADRSSDRPGAARPDSDAQDVA